MILQSFSARTGEPYGQPMPATTSDELRHFGEKGEGDWITVYAKDGHAFIVVAGLRLDTSSAGGRDRGPRWTTDSRSLRGFRARHPEGL